MSATAFPRPPGAPEPVPIVARLGLVADTHLPERCAALPPALFAALRGVDLVLHAGDVGELRVLDELAAIAPVIAVHGNDDTPEAQRELPFRQLLAVAGTRLVLTHGHHPDRAAELASRVGDAWGPKLDRWAAFAADAGARIVVHGHTHIPLAVEHRGVWVVNPGAIASGNAVTRQTRRSVATLTLRADGVPLVAHHDLDAPERPFAPAVDLAAGFAAALDGVSASILAPDLAARFDALRPSLRDLPEADQRAFWHFMARCARRCWSGERETLSVADLADALARDTLLPAPLRRQLSGLLAPA